MRKTLTLISIVAMLGIVPQASCARAAQAPATSPAADPFDSMVWELTTYLKGTAPQIRDRLNGEVERLNAKIQETQTNIREARADSETDQQGSIAKLRALPAYQALEAREKTAIAALEAARKDGTPADRIIASSRYNKIRTDRLKMEKDAANKSPEHVADLKRAREYEDSLKRYQQSLRKAHAWRNELLQSIRNAFRMQAVGADQGGPLTSGSSGILGEVTVLRVDGPDRLIVAYSAPQILGRGKDEEGIATHPVHFWKVKLLLKGINTTGLKEDDITTIDHNFVVDNVLDDEKEGRVFSAKAAPTDADRLMAMIVPLKEEAIKSEARNPKSETSEKSRIPNG
ncbi:MAG TPA: hypothetical protein VFC78_08060 [Tepidisphaeraceae bacterium]|nr:hypothetical protein [Tepidisphaeraceae bacterium]